jgi:predicted transcriptional regulator
MSPRAAWRLETLGFTEVYDYTAGEADWFAYGLPLEGAHAAVPHVGDIVQRDIPRCGLGERIADVRERTDSAGWNICVVVTEDDVVGLLREIELDADPDITVEAVMRSGPTTYRPDTVVTDAVEQLRKRRVTGVLVTRSDGTLLGWLRRDDAEQIVVGRYHTP